MTKFDRFASIRANKTTTVTKTTTTSASASSAALTLQQLGWNSALQTQLAEIELNNSIDTQTGILARVTSHHRQHYQLLSPQGEHKLNMHPQLPAMTVGDWVMLDSEQQFLQLFERQSLFSRKAAGSKIAQQLIAANVDWVFIVSSLNQDFNLNRIERYLALVNEAGVTPVVVLTKQDLCADTQAYITQLRQLDSQLLIETVNGLDSASVAVLASYASRGKTVALIGSSGVGKSTLVNSLLVKPSQQTSGIREDDAKGRHTTTGRSLHFTAGGGLLIDTPGMRELQLADCEQGVNHTFADITALAQQCRFADCSHHNEPGCAVQQAIVQGQIDERRLVSYQKLLREQALNGATIAQKRAHGKSLSKMYRRVQDDARSHKRG
ncbi:ribosome small subunit-dependent GTPase A [Shewanella sp. Scap07]|uniref:ribosome small subunit-dependent GTPase A n=1 Tax=Shewanella sp. Scap07 TaxID=2589987 RepID=UPI0015B87A7B|nr:ribosome small subunit-dependent GTPase A [Shewanella sp. Scap07]QLE84451.1 ribosome small subunit-dependent GTPase A [Shewanella sp. Scap07]